MLEILWEKNYILILQRVSFLVSHQSEMDPMKNIQYALLWLFIVTSIMFSACDRSMKDFAEDDLIVPSPARSETPNLEHDGSVQYIHDVPQAVNSNPYFPPPPSSIFEDDDHFGDEFLDIPFVAPYPVCGNGNVEPAEQCDDANEDNQDGCNVLCMFPICGNGILEKFEECDDNDNEDNDGCTEDCIYEVCGNKRTEKDMGEECDDGNHDAGDGCSPCCLFEKCGNRVIDPGEECDDGAMMSGDGCSDCCEKETAQPMS